MRRSYKLYPGIQVNGKEDDLEVLIEEYNLDRNSLKGFDEDIIFDNLWLLSTGIECLHNNLGDEQCLGIRNSLVIPYTGLSITHIDK